MAKIWKCYRCRTDRGQPGRDFIAEAPKCPACGLDAADPKLGRLIVQCRVVHFEAQHPTLAGEGFGIGCGELACGVPRKGLMVTGDPAAVNCPNCLRTDAWKDAKAALTGDTVELPNVEG